LIFKFETLAIAFFAALIVAAPVSRGNRRQKRTVMLLSGSLIAFILLVSRRAPLDVRMWFAHVYLVGGYWIPALLVPEERSHAFELWLVRTDAAWRSFRVTLPRWTAAASELAYLLCYPAVPVSFAAVWMLGTAADVDRYWLAVLASGFASYGCLPWLVSRPPRLIEERLMDSHPIATFNVGILRRVSHQMNTFPSGHVAVSVAAALSLLRVWTAGGVVMAVIAGGIAVGAVVGRYHYLLDVVLGAVVGGIAFVICDL
jgi:hypothetical protein